MEYLPIIFIVVLVLFSFVTIDQGSVGVVTLFGKYRRILMPGLNFKIPFLEKIYRRVSIQNQSVELEFQAITRDQANVNFKAMLLYSVIDSSEATIMNVAFKFINYSSFMQSLNRTVEASVRGFVAQKKTERNFGPPQRHCHGSQRAIG